MSKKQFKNKIKKTILLTGATGFLGSNLLKQILQNKAYKVIVLKRSFSNTFRIDKFSNQVKIYDIDLIDVEKVFLENSIDIILHCATDYGRKKQDILQTIEANLLLPVRLLEYAIKHKVKVFVNTDTVLDKRINSYSLSKQQFKDWLLQSKNLITCINVSLQHFYGPGDDQTKFASFIIHSFLKNTKSIDLTLGEQKRNFVFIDDIISAFLLILKYAQKQKAGFYEFQIGTKANVSIKNLVLLIQKLSGNTLTKLNFGALEYRENEVMNSKTNIKMIQSLGWSPKYSLIEGLKITIEKEKIKYNI